MASPKISSTGKRLVSVSVRQLVEYILRSGNLGGTGDFVGSKRGLEGTKGHQQLQNTRPPPYQPEVVISCGLETEELILEIKGRIDGVLEKNGSLLIEEIKTSRGPWRAPPNPLHSAQAKIYGFLYARSHEFDELDIQITYVDLETSQNVEFREHFSINLLEEFFQAVAFDYLDWVVDYHHWSLTRDLSIRQLKFPFNSYRDGQRTLAVAAFRAVKNRAKLFAEAPTGIGKTVSVFFSALKAIPEASVEKIFYLTAKTVGRSVAEKALADLRAHGLRLRSVTLSAKDKICFNNGQPCDLLTCPFAIGYYDRIKNALRDGLQRDSLTRPEIESIARAHNVCPFELSLDLSLWSDAIICDYNYVFHPSVSLKRYFDGESHDYAILVDEAHNLIDRAREMFSADLERQELLDLRNTLGGALPRCSRALSKLISILSALTREENWQENEGTLFRLDPPEKLAPALKKCLEEAELWLIENSPAPFRDPLLDAYFRLLSFQRVLDIYDSCYRVIYEPDRGRLRLFCVDPASQLRATLDLAGSVIFFSATLRPIDYFRDMLGGNPLDPSLQLSSPFPPENLLLLLQPRINTRLRSRDASYDAIVSSIGELINARFGNYLIYFPSYDYLDQVLQRFRAQYPECRIEVQVPGMTELHREKFLSNFQSQSLSSLAAFAVLGGVFGEGIDLIGDRLIGVVVVGVGLPQISVERNLIREHAQNQNRPGFDYAYTYPGMNRVLQALGRVIRSENDRGIVLLIDDRFNNPLYQALFPSWLQRQQVAGSNQISHRAREFWNTQSSPETPENPLPAPPEI